MNKIRAAAVLCCLTGCICIACDEKKEEKNASPKMPDKTDNVVTSSDKNKTLEEYIEVASLGCKVGKEKESVRQGHVMRDGYITFRVDKVELTKQQGNWIDLGIGPDLGKDGKIAEDKTYVVVDITLRQEGDVDFWWNSFDLSTFTEEDLRMGSIELASASILFSGKKIDLTESDHYHYSLPAGKNVKTSLIYVVEDQVLHEEGRHFLLEYNPTGANYEFIKPEDYCMVFLESMEVKDGKQGASE